MSHSTPIRVSKFLQKLNAQDTFTKIKKRSCLFINGPDSVKFLQGMTTNQMTLVERGGDGLFTGFLTSQGRLICDAFIYPVNKGDSFPHPCFVIECDSKITDRLQKHLKKYVMRNRVEIVDQSESYTVIQAWGPSTGHLANLIPGALVSSLPVGSLVSSRRFTDIGAKDARHPSLGIRFIVDKEGKVPLPPLFSERDESVYQLKRICMGIPEGVDDINCGNSLPLESNFDYMHGGLLVANFVIVVDFRKGCYLGQELTIRTYHTGVIRKRIIPMQLFKSFEEACEASDFMLDESVVMPTVESSSDMHVLTTSNETINERNPGKFCQSLYNVGLGLLRLEYATVQGQNSNHVLSLKNGMFARAFVPDWWPASTLRN